VTETINIWCEETEMYNDARFIGLTLSYGIARYLKQGYLTEQEVGLDHPKRVSQNLIGQEPIPWYFSYRVRIGIK
jgi:hypothetical protein